MHKLLINYSSLWISPAESVGDRNQQETDDVNDAKHVRLLTRQLSGSWRSGYHNVRRYGDGVYLYIDIKQIMPCLGRIACNRDVDRITWGHPTQADWWVSVFGMSGILDTPPDRLYV